MVDPFYIYCSGIKILSTNVKKIARKLICYVNKSLPIYWLSKEGILRNLLHNLTRSCINWKKLTKKKTLGFLPVNFSKSIVMHCSNL